MRNGKRKAENSNGESVVVVPRITGFPDQTRVKLVYEDIYTLTTVSNPYSTYTWRGNSVFDPDSSGGGHQPRYFDTYASVYNKYKVYNSSIMIEMINGSPQSGALFSIVPMTSVVSGTTWPYVSELPRAKTSEIMPVSSRYPFNLSHKATTTEINGLRPGQINDEDYGSAVTTNPTQIWYWNLYVQSIDNLATIGVSFRVRLVYDTLFYDRPDIAIS